MNNLVVVKILHPFGYLAGPAQNLGRENLLPAADVVVQCSLGAVLHHDTIAGGLAANPTGYRESKGSD